MTASSKLIFANNVDALRRRSARLADIVSETLPAELESSAAKNGSLSARYRDVWLHSRYNPESEAEKIAREAAGQDAELTIVLGLGLGYTARALIQQGLRVLVVESSAAWFSALLRIADMSDILESERCDIILCPDGDGLLACLDENAPKSMYTIENTATMQLFPEAAAAFKTQIAKYKQKDEINAATLKRFGKLWIKNIVKNIRAAACMPPLAPLEACLSGFPFVLVAAGPSLDAAASLLPALKERAVIVAVDTALRTVLHAGIEPDFIVVVDPQYWNARHLDGCASPSSILVSEAAVWPSVLRFKARKTLICSSLYPLGSYIEKRLGPPRGVLGAGGSVATSAWDLSRLLGAAVIYAAGLDLSFPEGKTHATESLFEQWALHAGQRLKPASLSSFSAMMSGKPFSAAANDGSQVISDARLALYASWFTRKCASFGVPTYNLSKHGLAIPELPYKAVETLLELPRIRNAIDKKLESALEALPDTESEGRLNAAVSELIDELATLSALSGQAAAAAAQARASEGARLAALLEQLERIDASLLRNSARDVIGFILMDAGHIASQRAKNLSESLDQSAALYTAIANSADWHNTLLKKLI